MNQTLKVGGRWIFLSVMVGIITGLATTLFVFLMERTHELLIVQTIGFVNGGEGSEFLPWFRPFLFLLIPTLGGLACGILVTWLSPESEGHGTDSVLHSFHREKSRVPPHVVLVKMLSSAVTIGSGGSAGPEGPMAQVGSGIGSVISNIFGLTPKERNILFIAGIAGGIGSIFRAPLGGAVFGPEILYSEPDFETDALVPCLISSITAYSVHCSLSGNWKPAFDVPAIAFRHPMELLLYVVLGLLLVLAGKLYIRWFYFFHDRVFGPLKLPAFLKPALGGFALGLLALLVPQIIGTGYPLVQQALYGKLTIAAMLGLALLKIVATSFTIGSRGSGGVFAPTVVIGGLVGGAFGYAAEQVFPMFVSNPTSYILVGMGGFLAGVANVPISALIMVAEMSHSYDLLVPIIFTVTVTYLLSGSESIFSQQVPSRIDSPAHLGDFSVDILSQLHVRDVIRQSPEITLHEGTPFDEVVRVVTSSQQTTFPVVDESGRLISIFTLDDVKSVLPDRDVWEILVARDLGMDRFTSLSPDETLDAALRKFTATRAERLPVLDPERPGVMTGMVSRQDLLSAYHQAMNALRRNR
ncbi:MAG TPA: chloride channel protein [Thermoanaerobaculia bacterium]|nr:chloride channel protein [Thermoanaerobaculia bacterium]HUM28669.1 chloride channel protein [Thermoanaerobaculia bacterium]HXK66723.1 chloride channel protein [Thermoanaerobaculia bacterium]